MFLIGQNIPNHITSLPQTVMNTPFGQMLRPYLDQSMRSITQAPIVQAPPPSAPRVPLHSPARVRSITSAQELESALDSAKNSCAVVVFTSSTCAPCKLLYPTYDELAQEAGDKAVLIKVDINFAQEIASKYKVHATPTIMTFLKGTKEEEWAGADVLRLKNTVQYLIRQAHPAHPHTTIRAFGLLDAAAKPVRYTKIPPLDKLLPKLGALEKDPAVQSMKTFLTGLNTSPKQGTLLTPSTHHET